MYIDYAKISTTESIKAAEEETKAPEKDVCALYQILFQF